MEYTVSKRVFGKLLLQKEKEHELTKYNNIDQLVDLDARTFWKLTRNKSDSFLGSHTMEYKGKTFCEPDELKEMWCSVYTDLLNENKEEHNLYDNEFRKKVDADVAIMEKRFSKTNDNTNVFADSVSEQELIVLSKQFSNNKSAGFDELTYENIKYAGYSFYVKLTALYNAMIKHVYIPSTFKKAVIIPAYKGKRKPKNDVNSYRGISLMPVLNKLFENVIWS